MTKNGLSDVSWVAENGLSGVSSTILVLVLGSRRSGNGSNCFGLESLEGKLDAKGVQEEGSATSLCRGGENGFIFAATGSGSRS